MGGSSSNKDEEKSDEEHIPYPKSVFFIISNEFCERFSYYGMKAILSLYFIQKLHFSEDTATVVYHTFSGLCYFFPIFGALIADQWLGKFKTIVYISMLYVLGHALKTVAAIPNAIPPVEFSLIGLLFIALGTGGIKPCVSAFGGDQFKLPQQEKQLQTFFSFFYFSINSGALISTFITPILREDVSCFGDKTCYSLAFGIPAILMLIATVIFIVGKPLYKINPPEGNIMTKVFKCIFYSLKAKIQGRTLPGEHWLDVSVQKFDKNLVEDVKALLRVLLLYVPIPVFWALFDQQGSRWTFQAVHMNGDCGSFIMKPDHMQLFNPILILLFIPLFDKIIYPFLSKCNLLTRPLQKMGVGGFLTALAFVISGLLELQVQTTYERLPKPNEAHLHVLNSLDCPIMAQLSNYKEDSIIQIDARTNYMFYDINPSDLESLKLFNEKGQNCLKNNTDTRIKLVGGHITSLVIDSTGHTYPLTVVDSPKKASGGLNKFKFIVEGIDSVKEKSIQIFYQDEVYKSIKINTTHDNLGETDYVNLEIGKYKFIVDKITHEIDIKQGGVHTMYLNVKNSQVTDFTVTKENSVHILWLVPQYVCLTMGEILFSIPGLEFSYSQAPKSMKSVLQAAWLLTVAFGNVIVIIVAESRAFDDQASEFFLFAFFMVLDMLVFCYLAYKYVYVEDLNIRKQKNDFSLSDQSPSKNGHANISYDEKE